MTYLVSLPGARGLSAPYAWVVSSLAGRFRPVTLDAGVPPDVVVVDSRDGGWVSRAGAAVASGVRAVVVAQPDPVPADDVAELAGQADRAGVLVGVDLWFGADPAWTAVLPDLVEEAGTAAVLHSSVRVLPAAGQDTTALQRALLAQLALVRPLLTAGTGLGLRTSRPGSHYVITGDGPGPAVCLSGVVSAGAGDDAEVTLLSVGRHRHVALYTDAPSRPAVVTAMTDAGSHTDRPHHESGLRAGWRALHSALDGTGEVGHGLSALTADLALFESVRP